MKNSMFCPKCNAPFDIHFMPDGTVKSLIKCNKCRAKFRIKIGFRGNVKSSRDEKENAIRRCKHETKDDRRRFDRSGLKKNELNHLLDILRDTFLAVEYPLKEKAGEEINAVDYSLPTGLEQKKDETHDALSEDLVSADDTTSKKPLNTGSYIGGYLIGFTLGMILTLNTFTPVWSGLIFIGGLLVVPLVFAALRALSKK